MGFKLTDKELRSFLASGMGGAPPLHETHPDAICIAVHPHEYQCPACKRCGIELAKPCPSTTASETPR